MKTTKSVWGKALLPAILLLAIAILVGLPFLKSRLLAQSTPPAQTTSCKAVGAVADGCYAFAPPCYSGQAFWLAGLDANVFSIPCSGSSPGRGSDGFKYIFTAGPFNTTPTFGTFTEFPNGTATLTGHIESSLMPGFGFDVNIAFANFSPVPDGNGPLLELNSNCYGTGPGQVNPANFHFYSTVTTATLTGTGNYMGASVTLTPHMHLPQFGPGANGKNHNQGGSAWFAWTVNHQPNNPNFRLTPTSPMGLSADFNIDCIPCTGTIGDFVWQDNNGNGCQDAGEPGMANVQVDLFSGCGGTQMIASTMTDSNGRYQFTGLCAGTYSVCFHTPNGFTHTLSNQACTAPPGHTSDEFDSDCVCTGTTSPCCVCVTLTTDNSVDMTIDCGYIPNCPLTVTKSCVPPAPPAPSPFSCSNMKPITALKVIWNGNHTVFVRAWNGTIGGSGVAQSTFGPIAPGQEITWTRTTASTPNDIFFEVFSCAAMTTSCKDGNSTFHLSCSDVDMNGPEDCGKAAGNGKNSEPSGFINTWIFDGMSGKNNIAINCGGNGSSGGTSCVLTPGPNPDCTTAGKPTSLTFQYTGGTCAASNNPQSGKFTCMGSVNTSQAITVSNSNGYTQSTTTVAPGGLITFSKAGSTFNAQSGFTLSNSGGTESLSIHTSCSQILAVGNVFGDLTLVGFNGQTAGTSITYHYTVTNNGGTTLNNVVLTDDQLGQIAGPFSLAAGETKSFDAQTTLTQTTTNTATATVQGQNCSATSGPVTVTVGGSPTPTPTPAVQTANCVNAQGATLSGKPKTLNMTYTGGSCASSMNSQGPPKFSVCQKFCCTESNGGLSGSSVHIIVSSSSSTPTGTSQRFFEGDVALNGAFTVSSGTNTFGANTYFFIYEGGVLKQMVQLHTSCSAPLVRGETFGGVQLNNYSN